MKTYKLKINGHDYEVVVNSVENNVANVTVNGAEYTVNVDRGTLNVERGTLNDNTKAAKDMGDTSRTSNAGGEATFNVALPPFGNSQLRSQRSTFNVVSPLPGVILDICVKEGDEVKEGQKVVVLEAMKMENAILAEKAGVVKKVHVSQGESVLEEAVLVTIG